MELSTRSQVKQIFSAFPTGNDNELITKSELSSGTSGLLTTDSSWGTNECIPASAIIPVRAYFCKSLTDKSPASEYIITKSSSNISDRCFFLSKPFTTLTFVQCKSMGTLVPINLDISPDSNEIPIFVYAQMVNKGNYWEIIQTSAAGFSCVSTYIMDGVQVDINFTINK